MVPRDAGSIVGLQLLSLPSLLRSALDASLTYLERFLLNKALCAALEEVERFTPKAFQDMDGQIQPWHAPLVRIQPLQASGFLGRPAQQTNRTGREDP